MLPYTFFDDVEKSQQYIVLGDTDSLYINIPSVIPNNTDEAISLSKEISTDINKIIEHYYNSVLLPKLGVSTEYNKIDFKTELVIASMLLLDTKKTYAYLPLAKENKAIENPKVKYTGIGVVRADYANFSKRLIRSLVEEIALNKNIEKQNIRKLVNETLKKFYDELKIKIDNYDFKDIGVPCKWGTGYKEGKIPFQLIGMRLYNTIMEDPVFSPMSAGLHLPITIINVAKFETALFPIRKKHERFVNDIPTTNFSKLVVPYGYDKEVLKTKMEHFSLSINHSECWDVLFSTVAKRIAEVILEYGK